MKKLRFITGGLVVITLLGLGIVKVTNAQTIQTGSNVNINQSQVVEKTIYTAGMTVDISSDVNGDVFCAGQTVTITGNVNGDVICAAQTINLVGKVNGDVRLAGQTISLSSVVSGNASLFGQSVNLSSSSKIGRDITIVGNSITINGTVGRDAFLGGNNAVITGTINRNVKAKTNDLNISSSATINGGLYYTSQKTANVAKGAQIKGQVVHSYPAAKPSRGSLYGFMIVKAIYLMIALLVTSLVLVLLLPQQFHKVTSYAVPKPWKALLLGFVVSIILPFVLLFFAITIIGLPLAFIFGLTWLLILMLSGPVFGYYLGRLVLRSSTQPILIMLVGVIILLILYLIPIVNIFAFLATVWLGAGMILLNLFTRLPKPIYNLETKPEKSKD